MSKKILLLQMLFTHNIHYITSDTFFVSNSIDIFPPSLTYTLPFAITLDIIARNLSDSNVYKLPVIIQKTQSYSALEGGMKSIRFVSTNAI
jgi:hypothetical protein